MQIGDKGINGIDEANGVYGGNVNDFFGVIDNKVNDIGVIDYDKDNKSKDRDGDKEDLEAFNDNAVGDNDKATDDEHEYDEDIDLPLID